MTDETKKYKAVVLSADAIAALAALIDREWTERQYDDLLDVFCELVKVDLPERFVDEVALESDFDLDDIIRQRMVEATGELYAIIAEARGEQLISN